MNDRHGPEALLYTSLWAWLVCGLVSSSVSAQGDVETTRLTDFRSPQGLVEEAKISPDGSLVVYRASQERWGRLELYSVPVAGGAVTKLSQELVPGGDVYDFEFSPDSQAVVFRADAEIDEKIELYRVPVTGGPAVKMNGPMVPAGDVETFSISPNQRFIAYTANQENFQHVELYSHDLQTGSVNKLNPPIQQPGDAVFDVEFSPDSAHVVYHQGEQGHFSDPRVLYSTPSGGGAAVTLGAIGAESFMVTADSQRVLFSTFQSDSELLGIDITGGSATAVLPESYAIDGPFLYPQDRSTILLLSDFEDEDFVLFKLDVAGGVVERISPVTSPATRVLRDPIYLSPDGSRVFFCTYQSSGQGLERATWSAPLAGGAPAAFTDFCFEPVLNEDGTRAAWGGGGSISAVATDGSQAPREIVSVDPQSGGLGIQWIHIDPTGSHVIFISDHEIRYRRALYSVPWAGNAVTLLNMPPSTLWDTALRPIQAVRDFVLYAAQRQTVALTELHRTGLTGGATTTLNGPMTGSGGGTSHFELSRDGSRVVFIADQRASSRRELWSYPVATGGAPALLSESVPDLQSVLGFRIDLDSRRVVFTVESEADGSRLVYGVPIEGGSAALLSDPADGDLFGLELTGSGDWFFYRSREDGVDEYRRALVTGSPIDTFASGVTRSVLSPGRQRLVYQAGEGHPWQTVLIEGGSPSQLAPAEAVTAIFSPDGTRVVYWIDQGFGELYSVSSAGGAVTRLHDSSSPCNGSDGFRVSISQSSRHVIFWCGGSQYGVPIDGGPAVLLTPFTLDLVTTSNDGATVFGLRDDFTLVSAPIEGGGYTELATLPAPGSFLGEPVRRVEVAPGDDFVFALVGSHIGVSNYTLWGVPVAGGPAMQYNEASSAVTDFSFTESAFAEDGTEVFYDQGILAFDQFMTPVRSELIRQPIAGGETFSYTPGMPLGGEIERFQIHGPSVLYSADLEQEDVVDLYLAIDTGLFSDGFESGDASAWSASVP